MDSRVIVELIHRITTVLSDLDDSTASEGGGYKFGKLIGTCRRKRADYPQSKLTNRRCYF